MSHDHHHHAPSDQKPTIQFNAALLFVIIVAGLFIASIGFVQSMSHDSSDAHHSEHVSPGEHVKGSHTPTEAHGSNSEHKKH